MAKDKITEYDATANNNTVCGDVNIAENSALPSDMNNFAREIMSHLKEGLGSGTPLYVDQTNNRVGIGNSSPDVPLEISVEGSSITNVLKLTTTGSGTVPALQFEGDASGTQHIVGRIRGQQDDANDGGLVFETESSGTVAERMRIDSSGRVMIGTTTEGATNEAEELTIAGTGGVGMTIRSTDSGTSRIYFSDGTSGTPEYAGYQIYNHSSNAMIFGTNATERMRIPTSDSRSVLSIGDTAVYTGMTSTTATSSSLISMNSGQGSEIVLSHHDALSTSGLGSIAFNRGSAQLSAIGGACDGATDSGNLKFYTTTTGGSISERMRITSAGRTVFYQTTSTVTQRYDTSSYESMYVSRFAINMQGNQSYTITFGGFTNGMYHFNCFAAHWNGGYTLYRNSYMGLQSSAAFSEYNLHNRSSGTQGEFSFTNPSNAKIAVVKSAGTYIGGMTAIIEIKGPALLNIDSVA